MLRNLAISATTLALVLSLGACSGSTASSSTSSSSNNEAAVRVPYDLDKVDKDVRQAGEKAMDAIDSYVDVYKKYSKASGSDQSKLSGDLSDAYSDMSTASEKLDNLAKDEDKWNIDTKQYYVAVNAYAQQRALECQQDSSSSDGSDSSTSDESQSNDASDSTDTSTSTATSKDGATSNTANTTTSQKNALAKASSYLALKGFSHDGLVEQLKYEGYSQEDATYAADNCGADWNEQAKRCAQSYMSLMSFSHSGLVQQLEYEKFTPEQAEYGASAVGL